MIAQQIARIIAHFVVFLECTDEENLDPVQVIEQLASDMEALDRDFRRELAAAFDVAALDYDGEARDLVRNIAEYFGLLDDYLDEKDPALPASRDNSE
jgi:hypothetical protein